MPSRMSRDLLASDIPPATILNAAHEAVHLLTRDILKLENDLTDLRLKKPLQKADTPPTSNPGMGSGVPPGALSGRVRREMQYRQWRSDVVELEQKVEEVRKRRRIIRGDVSY